MGGGKMKISPLFITPYPPILARQIMNELKSATIALGDKAFSLLEDIAKKENTPTVSSAQFLKHGDGLKARSVLLGGLLHCCNLKFFGISLACHL
jgi:hypothetical protein